MTDKETSDTVATVASRLMSNPSPFGDVKIRMAVQGAISRGVIASSPSAVTRLVVPDKVIDDIEAALAPYFADVRSVAASAVSQADGPE